MQTNIKGTILESVFTFQQFSADYVKDCDCWVVKHNDATIHDYWIISYDFDIKQQGKIFEKIHETKIAQDPSFNKNLSLLYVKRMDFIDLSIVDESIIEIENDPYYFKKYVLAYTDDSYEQLFKLVTEDFSGVSLSDIMMLPESFSKLQNEKSFGPYHLLYSLAHKIPFLTMEVKPKNFDEVAKLSIDDDDKFLMDWISRIDSTNGQEVMRSLIEKEEDD